MDALFLAITVAAVLFACVMGAIVLRVFMEDRRRSEARVAALAAAAADVPDVPDVATLEYDYEPVTPVNNLFAPAERSSAWGTRLAFAAIIFAIAAAGGYVMFSRSDSIVDQRVSTNETAPPVTAQPLELLSLRHTQQDSKLVITGLVQNPRGSATLQRVFATAFAFGDDGTFLASGRAPLDFSTLQPGDESPFVITVPVTSPVTRYRVGFRGEDGRVIAHVDRRVTGTVAQLSR